LFLNELRRSLAQVDGKSEDEIDLYNTLSRQDQLRLLNLKVWTERYRVPLTWILRVLLHEYFGEHRRSYNRSIGLRVSSFTGRKAEKYLADRIAQEFPNWQLERQFLAERRQRLLERHGAKPLKMTDLNPSTYQQQMDERARLEESARKLFSRPWRNNPWREL
jgi:hypothetical protein